MADMNKLEQHGDEVFVIAEVGVNHNGDEAMAHQLIDSVVESGAQFVKFQTFTPEALVAPSTAATPYQQERAGTASQVELLSALTLPTDAWARLRDHAHEAGIGFLSTPFDYESARMLVDLGVDWVKLSSGELTNLPFLRFVADLGVGMLVSTGMGSHDEVLTAVDACAAAPSLAIFHCVSAYPAPENECNLRAIPTLAEATGVPVGWSDHTVTDTTALIAASLGARLFEKHVTLDKTLDGPDHAASLEPDEFAAYVAALTAVPASLGDGVKRRMPSEQENASLVRRSWHAAVDLAPGSVLTAADVVALRPESGISPAVDIIGSALIAPLRAGEAIKPSDLEGRG